METKGNTALEHDVREEENIIDMSARLLYQTGSEVYVTRIQNSLKRIHKLIFEN